MRQDLPVPPTLSEPILQDLPAPPTDPQEFGKWAQSLSELAEQRAELRWQEGRAEGRNEGRLEGIQVGEERGIQIGEEKGLRDGILMVLRSRGVPIPAEVEARILACRDVAVLSAWLQRAVTLTDAAELASVVTDKALAS